MCPQSNCTSGQETTILALIDRVSSNNYALATFYFSSMAYLFVGIAIVADIFMNSIETITNQKRRVKRIESHNNYQQVTSVRVWNQTVANLTLMAFGSSAPEIFLATIEIVKNKFEADKLGPGTIVGASMFNTFVITAFCVVSLPNGISKQIRQIQVFWTTTVFSVTAYVWLYLILSVITPGRVTIVEALITLLLFPVMVLVGYLADNNFFRPNNSTFHEFDQETETDNRNHKESVTSTTLIEIAKSIEPNLSEAEYESLAKVYKKKEPHNIYRATNVNSIELSNLNFTKSEKTIQLLQKMKQKLIEKTNDHTLGQTVEVIEHEPGEPTLSMWKMTKQEWCEQIRSAFQFSNQENSVVIYLVHFISFVWKAMFALMPPTSLAGGWATLVCSVLAMAVLTGVMGDLATLFGCALGWDMHSTAIAVVAVGTSLPDLFASRTAAIRDNFADNAIGNINGSNAFNVFLGLGFPWLWAALYHHWNGTEFVVTDLANLAFSVQMFLGFSVLHLALLTVRRKFHHFGRAELGGPKITAYISFLVLITVWFVYVVVSIIR